MTDNSVKFSIDIEQNVSDTELDKKIQEEVNKRMEVWNQKMQRAFEQQQELEMARQPQPNDLPPRVEHENRTTESEGGLISKYGGAQQPRKYYPVKRDRREIPETGDAPFEFHNQSQSISPGTNYTEPRGFQQEKVRRRGAVRYGSDSPDNTSVAGIQPDSIREKIRDMEEELKAKSDKTEVEKMMNEQLSNIMEGSQVFTNPQRFVQDNLLKTLGNVARSHPIISLLVSAIMAGPHLYELAKGITQQMAVKGGPLNRDFVIQVEEVITGFLSIEAQHLRDVGLKGFVVSQADGYAPVSGTDVYNSLLDKDEVRINRIPLEDRV